MQFGREFGLSLKPGTVLFLEGDLGAGKTTFVKGMATAFQIDQAEVSSPTFQYLNIYKGSRTLYHFDLYRLADESSFFEMGFHEFLEGDGIACVEWSERLQTVQPKELIKVQISHSEMGRLIQIKIVE